LPEGNAPRFDWNRTTRHFNPCVHIDDEVLSPGGIDRVDETVFPDHELPDAQPLRQEFLPLGEVPEIVFRESEDP